MKRPDIDDEAIRNAVALIAAAANEDYAGGELILADIFAHQTGPDRALVLLATMCSELLRILCSAGGHNPNELLRTYALRLAEESK